MGTDYELKNRYLHLDYKKEEFQTAKSEVSNGKICLKELPVEEKTILEVIIAIPEITQKEIASKIGKSERTVRNKINSLKDKGIPFDPLKKADPDITLSAEDREIGGLGIFITKKTMVTFVIYPVHI